MKNKVLSDLKATQRQVAEQKALFDSLLKTWGRVSAAEVDRILDEREPAEPEADLTPELISKLKKRIAECRRKEE